MNIRKTYLDATVLDQEFLDRCSDELVCDLEMVVDIQAPDGGFIRASDRNKYVGTVFYEALLNLPVIERTLGEWLAGVPEFSSLTLDLNNATGRFNEFVPGGALYESWVGNTVTVRLGLRDVESTYRDIFKGFVTEVGGFQRNTSSVTIIARDQFHEVNNNFPLVAFSSITWPDIEGENDGLAVPLVMGNWQNVTNRIAALPSFVLNGKAAEINPPMKVLCQHSLYVGSFDTSRVYLERGSALTLVPPSSVTSLDSGRRVEIAQNWSYEGGNYRFELGDKFYVRFAASAIEGTTSHAVPFAKFLLKEFGGRVDVDFDSTWATYATLSPPCRVWVQESTNLLEYTKSLLLQVGLELFVNKDLKLSLNRMYLPSFNPSPALTLQNWDVERDTFQPEISETNNFNRAQAVCNYMPTTGEEFSQSAYLRNDAAIAAVGKQITKRIVFPNVISPLDAETLVRDMLRISSSFPEIISLNATWRMLFLDVGDFVTLDINIGGVIFDNANCQVRALSYNPDAVRIQLTLMSFQMCPYPGYEPGYAGTVGGYNAVITKEYTP